MGKSHEQVASGPTSQISINNKNPAINKGHSLLRYGGVLTAAPL